MTQHLTSFITGATGFVGAAVARTLQGQGHKLRLLARPGSPRQNIEDLQDVEIIEGDLLRPESYAHALKGCTGLFHVAADYRIWVPDPAAMNKVNIEGTEALLRAARVAGVERMVYTSSVATLGIHKDGTPSNEDTPVALENMIGVYKRSKFLAEQTVRRLIEDEGLPCVIVNPSTPIGPRDVKPTPTGRIITEAMAGKIPAYVDTGLNVVHVDDVAQGHLLAYEKGKIGERYILGGEDLAFGDILKIVSEIVDRPAPTLKLPRLPLYPIAFAAELIARFTKREPMLTIDGLNMSKKKMFFSSAKAMRELGYTARPAREAIRDAILWFQANPSRS